MRCVNTIALALALVCSSSLPAQNWNLLDSGVGIVQETSASYRILERDRSVWHRDEITQKLGPGRIFMFWIRGPRPETFKNRFGIPVFDYTYVDTRPGEAPRACGRFGFNEEGWGGYQLDDHPGPHKIEVYLINRDTEDRRLVATLNYTIASGKGNESTSAPPAQTTVVYLSDLQESASGDIHGGLGKDHPYWCPELVIGSRTFRKGLVTHAPADSNRKAYVEYALDGTFQFFQTTLGSAGDRGVFGDGSMNFAVLVDNRPVVQGRMPTPPQTRELKIPLQGARKLRLEVDNGGNGNAADHAAWGDARLVK